MRIHNFPNFGTNMCFIYPLGPDVSWITLHVVDVVFPSMSSAFIRQGRGRVSMKRRLHTRTKEAETDVMRWPPIHVLCGVHVESTWGWKR